MKIIKIDNCWECPYMGRSSDNALYWCREFDHDAPTVKELFAGCELEDEREVMT